MTERLYYRDSHLVSFEAVVLGVTETKKGFETVLDKTAFFPEGGGQPGDRGTVGDIAVLDTRERGGEVVHLCEKALPVGETVSCAIDWPLRFGRMQEHSGEHIVSGLAHQLWGCENVGFHMAETGDVTLDFDRELTGSELAELERRANEKIWENLPIRAWIPPREELEAKSYRQKKPLEGDIRLVEIPGVDCCACCAPHVNQTGEIGLIRFMDSMRHRGGVRITMRAGRAALDTVMSESAQTASLSRLLSAPRSALTPALERVQAEKAALEQEKAGIEREYTLLRASQGETLGGAVVFFEPKGLSAAAMRALAEAGSKKAALCAVYAGAKGEYRYVLASETVDLRTEVREMNSALSGRGGGAKNMVQGSLVSPREAIEEYWRRHGEER